LTLTVITSYAIFHRDAEELLGRTWDVAILDEAQVIKNPKTTHSENASRLKARQRIALTGTPIENHLGELWSIVSFAAPGALGSKESFRAAYRNPIERDGNQERLESLRRRLSPILMRRTKEQVATELPPKNVIRHPVELGDGQRDLYEVVRASVKAAVQAAIASKGSPSSAPRRRNTSPSWRPAARAAWRRSTPTRTSGSARR
jgi:SNF2 family DNA or RNA helicase